MKADVGNQLTAVTFSQPVEIPGRVLPAGTYLFKVFDFNEPNIVEIFNQDQSQILATLLTVPDYRHKPTGKTVITFNERAAGSPEAIQAWFYPGRDYGHEFVYPRTRARELAKMTNKPVPSMPDNIVSNATMPAKSSNDSQVTALRKTRVTAMKPSGEEVEANQVFMPPPTAH
jgi:hypothetical protein